ncbi:hypothetical protein G4Z16_27305 [Streptomyces bathyalis]|uniref:Uncharacterized protein n=1 Tax=Streptomyces bathyalis TaxID=2710756 RepID=A0A7T1TAR0_9ACTN|nr:hypothetical protein [Streptomyces bathyalis]QPP09509.1 hypothetical protein G4Z16_27305 [Streptomyces bathyalis]
MRGYSASPAPVSVPESATAAAAADVPARVHGGCGDSLQDGFRDGFRDGVNVRVRRGHVPHRGRPRPGMLLRGTTTAR